MEKIIDRNETNVSKNDRQLFQDNEIKRICSGDTDSIKTLNIANNTTISSLTLTHFSGTKWNNLTFLNLYNNRLEGKGCKYITNASMKNLTVLDIGFNKIDSLGVFHLSKGQWNKLEKVYLGSNKIQFYGIFWLSKGIWSNNLQMFSLFRNQMPEEQLKLILLAQLKHIKSIKLDQNLKERKEKPILKQKIQLKYNIQEVLV